MHLSLNNKHRLHIEYTEYQIVTGNSIIIIIITSLLLLLLLLLIFMDHKCALLSITFKETHSEHVHQHIV